MSDSRTGPRSAGFGPLGDSARIDRFDLDAFFAPPFVKGDDGRWTLAVAGALYTNAEDELELRTDGTTLVQEPGSPTTLKSPLQAALIQEAKVRRADDSTLSARLTTALAGKMNTSRAVRFTESVTPTTGEGVEIIEASSASAPVVKPFSNNGTADLNLYIFGLGTGQAYVNGAVPVPSTSRLVPIAHGVATLVGGTVTIALATVQAGATIVATHQTFGGTAGLLSTSLVASTSVTITSANVLDTSTVSYAVWNP